MPTEFLFLAGKTRKGKNRVQELGDKWIRILFKENVSFSVERNWILITPVSNTEKVRWIKAQDDVDFSVLRIEIEC